QNSKTLRGECLVELKKIDVFKREAGLLKRAFDRRHWPESHISRLNSRGRIRNHLRQRRQLHQASALLACDDKRRRTVVNSGSVAGGHRAVLPKRRLQPGQLVGTCAGARVFVDSKNEWLTLLLRYHY